MKRIVLGIILVALPFVAPWWFVVVAAVILSIFVPQPYELIATGFILDNLYTLKPLIFNLNITWTVAAVAYVLILIEVKKNIFIR